MTGASLGSDRGAAAALSLALTVLIVSAALAVAMVGSVAVARARAGTVADLAALAGARTGSCGDAQTVAERNAMHLVQCDTAEGDVVVRVTTPTPELARRVAGFLGGRIPDVEATARAGFVGYGNPG